MKTLYLHLSKFCSGLFASKPALRQKPRRHCRLMLEQLEDRLAPATFNVANGDLFSAAVLTSPGVFNAGLITAITASNTNAQADTINLASGGTYTLTVTNNTTFGNNGLPLIVQDVVAGNTLTINGNNAVIQRGNVIPEFRILENDSGTVILNNLTLRNGRITNASANGGAIRNDTTASLTLNNCTVSGSSTNGSFFASGGGIVNNTGATLNINNSTISGNSANAIFSAVGAFGGGIDNRGTMNINNSTISGNSVNSTTGTYGGGGIGISGGGAATINNSTITNNRDTTGAGGGGIRVYPGNLVSLRSSIVAGNTTTTAANGPDIRGTIEGATSVRNLIGIGTALTGISNGLNGNLIGTQASPINPQLSPLANNGGPTQTHALAPTSPAVAKGQNFTAFTNDQRGTGFPRATNGAVDIGAVQRTIPAKPVVRVRVGRRFGR